MLGALAKLTRGTLDADGLISLLESMGVNIKVTPIGEDRREHTFDLAARRAQIQGTKMLVLAGRMKNGDEMEAVILMRTHSTDVTAVTDMEKATV